MRAPLLLLLLALLTACGELPQPFFGNPGASATRLAQPPPSRLTVPTPAESLLTEAAATAWARQTATALVANEIPAAAAPARRGREWSLTLAAEIRGNQVVPSYTVLDPAGASKGTTDGPPVPSRDWANGDPAVQKAAAEAAAPAITALLNRIEAARQQSDPNSLVNRQSRIYLAGVEGAPGDGNRSLADQMRNKLGGLGFVVQDTARDADFEVKGDVHTAPGANGTLRIELQWIVLNGTGELGRIVQINEVPPRTVTTYWGDVAVAAATEASGGVRDVINNAVPNRKKPTA